MVDPRRTRCNWGPFCEPRVEEVAPPYRMYTDPRPTVEDGVVHAFFYYVPETKRVLRLPDDTSIVLTEMSDTVLALPGEDATMREYVWQLYVSSRQLTGSNTVEVDRCGWSPAFPEIPTFSELREALPREFQAEHMVPPFKRVDDPDYVALLKLEDTPWFAHDVRYPGEGRYVRWSSAYYSAFDVAEDNAAYLWELERIRAGAVGANVRGAG